MRAQRWVFEAGARAPRWLVETIDCTAIFNWSAVVQVDEEGWLLAPREPVRRGSPPFLLRPATEHHRGVAVPTGMITVIYDLNPVDSAPTRTAASRMKVAAPSTSSQGRGRCDVG